MLSFQERCIHTTEAAKSDIAHHIWYGVDLNPYSTELYRREWKEGFESHKNNMMREHDMIFLRGRAAAVLMKKLAETGTL